MKKLIKKIPFNIQSQSCWNQGRWPARWIGAPGIESGPVVMMFRLEIDVPAPRSIDVHVSADERYILYLNGNEEGRGSERGSINEWFFETRELQLKAGQNLITAKVWAAGDLKPFAQLSCGPAFLLATEDSLMDLSTGIADWQVKVLPGYHFVPAKICWGRRNDIEFDGRNMNWEAEAGGGDNWQKPVVFENAVSAKYCVECKCGSRMLYPTTLPDMTMILRQKLFIRHTRRLPDREQENPVSMKDHDLVIAEKWANICKKEQEIVVPAETACEVIIDFDDYVCAYNGISVSGGRDAVISLLWAESLFESQSGEDKGNRDEVEGKYFIGEGDRFILDGGERQYDSLWWHAGRYLKVRVITASEPVIIRQLHITETGYPLDIISTFRFSDERLNQLTPIMTRALQMCSHEALMDCPYYEQMMYVGDTRLELLTIYTLSDDDRLPRKAITTLNSSRDASGRMSSRWPTHVRQLIPGFDLFWVGMVYDFALWRGNQEFVRRMMPGVRMTLDVFLLHVNSDNILETPNGWNFIDWVPAWNNGVPPVSHDGICGILNWHLIYTLVLTAELEDWLGQPEVAAIYRRKAEMIARAVSTRFWSDRHGMFADDIGHSSFSEHSQCLAILSGQLSREQEAYIFERSAIASGIARTTIYFSHYLFEAAYKLKRPDVFFNRLEQDWYMLADAGFKTTYETPPPSRSDCHAWGAHPLYHFYASVIGARPSGLGSDKLTVKPMLAEHKHFEANLNFRGQCFPTCSQEKCNSFVV